MACGHPGPSLRAPASRAQVGTRGWSSSVEQEDDTSTRSRVTWGFWPLPETPKSTYSIEEAPWAREGSRFTLLFEQAALMLVREMPVLAAARIIEITDQRLWRIVTHYVGKAVERLDLSKLAAVGLDETAAKRGQNYVTVFIDIDRGDK